MKTWPRTNFETEQKTQSASNTKHEIIFGNKADPKMTETEKPKTPMDPSNTRKVIEIIPISFRLSIGEFNSERKTKTFPNYSPFGIQRGNSRMFNQKSNRHPLFLRNVAASKPEVAIKAQRN